MHPNSSPHPGDGLEPEPRYRPYHYKPEAAPQGPGGAYATPTPEKKPVPTWLKGTVGALGGVALLACLVGNLAPASDDVEDDSEPAVAEETTESEPTDASLRDSDTEFVFVALVREHAPSWDLYADDELVVAANQACDIADEGRVRVAISVAMTEKYPHVEGTDVAYLTGTGIHTYCPEHLDPEEG